MTFKKRLNHHRSMLRANKHKNQHLQNSYNKYGEDNFEFTILEVTLKKDTLEIEQGYLDACEDCFNINPLASGTPNMSKEVILKRSKTFQKTTSKASEYYYLVKEGEIELSDVPEKYCKLVEFRLKAVPWNKGLTKENIDYSYLKVPKAVTEKSVEARRLIAKNKRDKADNVYVYNNDFVLLYKFRCCSDIEEWSATEENDLPVVSRFKKERMGKPLNWLSKVNVGKSCITEKSYKGLYFRRIPLLKEHLELPVKVINTKYN